MQSDPARQYAVVIPAYNEGTTIANIASRARQFIEHVIIINDGSTDNTSQALKGQPVTLLNNPANLGKGKSLALGAAYAIDHGATAVITLDGDGQHHPEDIPRLIAKSATNPDKIIIAARLHSRHRAPPLRRFANRFADFWISWAAGHCIRDSQSGFRLYPAEVFQQCQTRSNNFVFESEILIDAAHKGIFCVSTTIDTVYLRNSRPSHYRPATDTWAIVKMVAGKLLQRGLYPVGLLRSLGILPHPDH
jgi:glycosyltransferase involved in cell wall biosynthesis